jgi:hypothetical protein
VNARDAFTHLILADEASAADLGDRVYPRWVPEGTDPPYATLTIVSEVPQTGLKGSVPTVRTRLQIDVFAADLPTAERVALRIRKLLDGCTKDGPVTVLAGDESVTLTFVQWEDADGDFERFDNFGDSGYERVSLDFLAAHEEAD